MKSYVVIRAVVYVLLAMLAAFSGWLNDITPERVSELTWLDWSGMAVSVLSAGLIAFRSYIDGSAERNRQEKT